MESGNNQSIKLCVVCRIPLAGIEPQLPKDAIRTDESWEFWKKYNEELKITYDEWQRRKELGDKWLSAYSEWKRVKQRHEECERRYERLYQSHVPQRFWWSPPLTPTEGNKQAIEAIRTRVKNNQKSKGLFLYGDVGVGKTHLLARYAQYLILKEGEDVIWWDTARLFITLKNNFGKRYEEGEENEIEDIIRSAIWARWLFLDDLGREKPSDWTHEVLFHIVNSRYEDKKNTIIVASNFSPSQLAERIGDQIVSRLIEMCEAPVKINGEDWRLKKAEGGKNDPQSPASKI